MATYAIGADSPGKHSLSEISVKGSFAEKSEVFSVAEQINPSPSDHPSNSATCSSNFDVDSAIQAVEKGLNENRPRAEIFSDNSPSRPESVARFSCPPSDNPFDSVIGFSDLDCDASGQLTFRGRPVNALSEKPSARSMRKRAGYGNKAFSYNGLLLNKLSETYNAQQMRKGRYEKAFKCKECRPLEEKHELNPAIQNIEKCLSDNLPRAETFSDNFPSKPESAARFSPSPSDHPSNSATCSSNFDVDSAIQAIEKGLNENRPRAETFSDNFPSRPESVAHFSCPPSDNPFDSVIGFSDLDCDASGQLTFRGLPVNALSETPSARRARKDAGYGNKAFSYNGLLLKKLSQMHDAQRMRKKRYEKAFKCKECRPLEEKHELNPAIQNIEKCLSDNPPRAEAFSDNFPPRPESAARFSPSPSDHPSNSATCSSNFDVNSG